MEINIISIGGIGMSTFALFFHMTAGYTVVSSMYKEYIESIGWNGNEQVLEFGCGTGCLSRFIIKKINKGQLACLDVSELSIKILKWILRKHKNVQYYIDDIRDQKMDEGTYDKVIIHYMLHDIPKEERQPIINELSKIIKVGGQLHIREPINENHGMPAEEIQSLMTNCGLKKTEFHFEKRAFAGHMYSAAFQK